jgi:hypothetical protein
VALRTSRRWSCCERAFGFVAEPDGEPVEEFGVGRERTHAAEVVRGIDEAGAEVVVPDAIDDGAPGEDVGVGGDPGGEGGAAGALFAAGIGKGGAEAGHAAKGTPGDRRFAGGAEVAAVEDVDRPGG